MTSNATWTLNFVSRNLHNCHEKTKEKAYTGYVQPKLEYASTVWNPYTKKNIYKIEQVQRRAARFVTGRYQKMDSPTAMMKQLQWPTLERRREVEDLVMYHQIVNKKVCIPIELFRTPTSTDYNQRGRTNPTSFQLDSPNVNQYKYSFFQRTTPTWNWLPEEVTELDNPRHQIASILEDRVPLQHQ